METITDPSLYCDKLDWLWAPLSDLGFNIQAPRDASGKSFNR